MKIPSFLECIHVAPDEVCWRCKACGGLRWFRPGDFRELERMKDDHKECAERLKKGGDCL